MPNIAHVALLSGQTYFDQLSLDILPSNVLGDFVVKEFLRIGTHKRLFPVFFPFALTLSSNLLPKFLDLY